MIPNIGKIPSAFIFKAIDNNAPVNATGIENNTTNGYKYESYNATIIR